MNGPKQLIQLPNKKSGDKTMGEEKKVSGSLPTREDIKARALALLGQQQSERNWCLLRMLELEEELNQLKDRAVFLKGAMEALKVTIDYTTQGPTPKTKAIEEKKGEE